MLDLFRGDLLSDLDAAQFAAATAQEKQVLVRSGAGTGKTRVLVARILHLVRDRKVAPERVIAVTFTNKAAREIRERVADHIGWVAAKALRVGTFHSLSARLLRKELVGGGVSAEFKIADQGDSDQILKVAIAAAFPREPHVAEVDWEEFVASNVKPIGAVIRSWKSNGLHISSAADPKRVRRTEEEETLVRVYKAYQQELQRRDTLDFGDLVLEVLHRLTRSKELRETVSGAVEHLLVDEGQDANPCQMFWVRAIAQVHRNIFVVGDEDQSIFAFQGGFPGAMQEMAGAEAKHYELSRNRRCTDEVLTPACALVNWNRNHVQHPKRLWSGVSGAPVGVHRSAGDREEATRLAIHVKDLLKSGVSASDVVLLFRSGWAMKPFEEALLRARVPYAIVGGTVLLDREEIRDVVGYLMLTIDPFDQTAFERISNKPQRGVGPMIERSIIAYAGSQSVSFHEACVGLSRVAGQAVVRGSNAEITALGRFLRRLDEEWRNSSKTTRAYVDMICGPDGLDYEGYLRRAHPKDVARRKVEVLSILKRLADDFPDLEDFLEKLILGEIGEQVLKPTEVRLSTMHSSKGLEWDYVFLPAFDEAVVPSPRAGYEASGVAGADFTDRWRTEMSGGVEEERRLVHVAMTRARKEMHLSFATSRAGRELMHSFFLPEAGLDAPEAKELFGDGLSLSKAGSKKAARAGRKTYATAPF